MDGEVGEKKAKEVFNRVLLDLGSASFFIALVGSLVVGYDRYVSMSPMLNLGRGSQYENMTSAMIDAAGIWVIAILILSGINFVDWRNLNVDTNKSKSQILITGLLIGGPALLFVLGLLFVYKHLLFAFIAVPIAALLILGVRGVLFS
jgi:hypothetical protein